MFFHNKNNDDLINDLYSACYLDSKQLLNIIYADEELSKKCGSEVQILNSGFIFMLNVYRDLLNSKYEEKKVFDILCSVISKTTNNENDFNIYMEGLMHTLKICNELMSAYKGTENFSPYKVLAIGYLSLIFEDKEYLANNIDNEIDNSRTYKEITNYIENVVKNTPIKVYNYKLK